MNVEMRWQCQALVDRQARFFERQTIAAMTLLCFRRFGISKKQDALAPQSGKM